MNGGLDPAASRRLAHLAEKFHDKQYRDSYVASHTRGVLSQQMRNFRGDLSQAEYADKIGKQKTVIGRLENPGYAGWSLRTMLETARKENVAVLVRFVDFPTFLKYTDDLSDKSLNPTPYDANAVDQLAAGNNANAAVAENNDIPIRLSNNWKPISTSAQDGHIEVTSAQESPKTERITANDNSLYYQITVERTNVG
jgi:hypothetical protein